MRKIRPLNPTGIWLSTELESRNISKLQFAELVNTTPQNLTDILRGDRFSQKTLEKWKTKFRETLLKIDRKRNDAYRKRIVYQIICTTVVIDDKECFTYGLQVLQEAYDNYVVIETIHDITLIPGEIFQMKQQFNEKGVSIVHFKELILDQIGCY